MDETQDKPVSGDLLLCCRACLSADGRLYNIHAHRLSGALAQITGSPVNNLLPQYLCSYCATRLRKSASFREMCLSSQQILTLQLFTEKLTLDSISKIDRPKQILTLSEIQTTNVNNIQTDTQQDITEQTNHIHIKLEPETNMAAVEEKTSSEIQLKKLNTKRDPQININGVIKKIGEKIEFNKQIRLFKIPADKVKYINKRVRNINNIIKTKMQIAKDDNPVNNVASSEGGDIKIEDTNNVSEECKNKENIQIKKYKIIKSVQIQNTRVIKKVAVKRIDLKPAAKRGRPRKKRKTRNAENDFLPIFDFAKFENGHAVKIITLTKEEQLEEIASRKKSLNYLESQFKCEGCGKGFNGELAYNNHRAKHSPERGAYVCEICSVRYRRRFQVQVHRDMHRLKFVCNECSFVSRNRCQAKKHHEIHNGKTYQCEHCGKTFEKVSTYFSHVRGVHPALGSTCHLCGDTFVGEHGLRMHKARMHDEKSQQHKCPTCSAKFVSVEALSRYTDTAGEHVDLRPCEQCGENCASEGELRRHVEETHPQETHRCEECDMAFPSRAARDVHTRRLHRGRRPRPAPGARSAAARKLAARRAAAAASAPASAPSVFMCEHCGRVAKNAALLRSHQQQHHEVRRFACDHCQKTFVHKTLLESHMRTHTGEKPFRCTECPLAFSLNSNLKRHRKTAHEGVRARVPCTTCGRELSTRSALKLHVSTVHQGRPWPRRDRRKPKREPWDV